MTFSVSIPETRRPRPIASFANHKVRRSFIHGLNSNENYFEATSDSCQDPRVNVYYTMELYADRFIAGVLSLKRGAREKADRATVES